MQNRLAPRENLLQRYGIGSSDCVGDRRRHRVAASRYILPQARKETADDFGGICRTLFQAFVNILFDKYLNIAL